MSTPPPVTAVDRAVIPAPRPAPPRLTPRPLPAYRYVPGLQPHPFRHAEGHLWCGGGAPEVAPWTPAARWQDDEAWLWGLELLAQRYWWEAHEALEGLWHRSHGDPALRRGTQGLILAAAALLKHHLGQPRPAQRLAARAAVQLAELGAPGTGLWRGVLVEALVGGVQRRVGGGPAPCWTAWLVAPGGVDVP